MDINKTDAFLILNAIPDVGSIMIKNLLSHFGSAEKVLNAPCGELIPAGSFGKKIAENIINWRKHFDLEKEYKLIEKHGVSVITIDMPGYPELLKEIYDPPIVLYVKGSFMTQDKNALAIVGARRASYYGLNMAKKFAFELSARGFTIVSGFARGVDTAAHEGALKAGGRTIAVFGCGIDRVYPSENAKLIDKVASNGAIITEFPFGVPPLKQNFPKRNRIISGLSLGVIVVEAGKHSGSLITARLAAEQGRDVYSIPGRIDSVTSEGTNVLIKHGAKPVFGVEDILEEMDYVEKKQEVKVESIAPSLGGKEEKLYSFLGNEPVNIDEIIGGMSLPVNEVWKNLVNLELKGLVTRLPGSKFIRKD